ncbi:MAG TPA: hypothetical protein PKC62_07345 [Ferruginibacter sp.]|nr:hypothetical protein [Chitinophagaceae bacterium]HMT96486.1 hypothetical protein [Ferruginibacter sp.]
MKRLASLILLGAAVFYFAEFVPGGILPANAILGLELVIPTILLQVLLNYLFF